MEPNTPEGPTRAPAIRLAMLGTLAFTLGWATLGTMGEVVGEARGGDFRHQLGHTIGTVLLIVFLSLAT